MAELFTETAEGHRAGETDKRRLPEIAEIYTGAAASAVPLATVVPSIMML